MGEYPLSWSACLGNESVYNLLLEEGADPDNQVFLNFHCIIHLRQRFNFSLDRLTKWTEVSVSVSNHESCWKKIPHEFKISTISCLSSVWKYILQDKHCLPPSVRFNLRVFQDSYGNTVLHMVVVTAQLVSHNFWKACLRLLFVQFVCQSFYLTQLFKWLISGYVRICTEASQEECKSKHKKQERLDLTDTVLRAGKGWYLQVHKFLVSISIFNSFTSIFTVLYLHSSNVLHYHVFHNYVTLWKQWRI